MFFLGKQGYFFYALKSAKPLKWGGFMPDSDTNAAIPPLPPSRIFAFLLDRRRTARIISLTWPILVATVVQSLFTLVDLAFVGSLG